MSEAKTFSEMMFRKVVIGSGMIAFIPAIKAATPVPVGKAPSEPQKPPPMKLSDLPLYDSPHADYGEYVTSKGQEREKSYIRSSLEGPVKAVREQVQGVLQQTSAVTDTVVEQYHELTDRSDWIVKYLREEENKDVRYGAVVMGGLTGFIFGLRGGFIRRVFYAGIGTTAMGAVCFPEQTAEIAHSNGQLARTYINIAYNFLYGVKPGDPQLELKFPDLTPPKDFKGFLELVASLTSTIKQAVMPPPAKDDSKPSEKKD